MSWVPIVGSAFGNILGGFVSDYFIGKQTRSERALRPSADVAVSPLVASFTTTEALHNANSHQHRSADSSANKSTDHGEFMVSSESAVDSSPLMASMHGDNAQDGGNDSVTEPVIDQSLRMWIAGWSNILPVPLIVGAFLLEFPYCFLIMICSGMVSCVFIFSYLDLYFTCHYGATTIVFLVSLYTNYITPHFHSIPDFNNRWVSCTWAKHWPPSPTKH